MEVKEDHKPFLKKLGLGDEDFKLFDGKFVSYEFDAKRGVRIYDPYYTTSYDEYIGIDGWSAWSDENDTFMSDILKSVQKKVHPKTGPAARPTEQEISGALQKKFGKTPNNEAK